MRNLRTNLSPSTIENLEPRQFLSADAFIEAGGRLVVRGTDAADQITIGKNPSNAAQVRVVLNKATYDFSAVFVKEVKVEAGKGNDLVQSDASKGAVDAPMFFLGDAGSDTLVSGTGDDALIGGGDADVIIAKAGNNYLNGGDGNDKLFAGGGNDTIVAGGGANYISDAGGKNVITSAKSDTIVTAALPTTIPSATGQLPSPPPVTAPPVTPTPTPTPTPTTPVPVGANPFVIGVWSQPYWSFDKWQARGINTVVGYESLSGTVSVEKFSDEAVKRGLYMIRHPNPDPTKDKNQKNLLAWMLNDEPDYHNTAASVLKAQYDKLKAADKDIPVFVNFSGSSALWGYGGKGEAAYKAWMANADWISNDLYPITAHNRASALDAPGLAAERLADWSGGKRQMVVIEASDQQLPGHENYPGVTPDQFRAEVFNAVISGATGIIYFPQKIGGGFLFDSMNPQVEAEMKSVNARIARIGNALMTQENPAGVSFAAASPLKVTWRKYGGKTYAVVLNNSANTVSNAKLTTTGVTAKTASVDGESRAVAINGGQITDTFKPYEAHVYAVG